MLAQLAAIPATVGSGAETILRSGSRTFVAMAIVAVTLGGCMPATGPLAAADPADPGARVAGTGYRSTIAPYTRLRPTAPSSWREQNDRVAPAAKPDR
jgi:hypothetical protein